jgi:hypothetical protein
VRIDQVYDATGKVVMAGSIDIHSHNRISNDFVVMIATTDCTLAKFSKMLISPRISS